MDHLVERNVVDHLVERNVVIRGGAAVCDHTGPPEEAGSLSLLMLRGAEVETAGETAGGFAVVAVSAVQMHVLRVLWSLTACTLARVDAEAREVGCLGGAAYLAGPRWRVSGAGSCQEACG